MVIYFMIAAFVVLLSIIFRVAAIFRLTVPLLYALLGPTLFSGWFHANPELSNAIGYALLGLVALSWVVSLIRRIRRWRMDRIEERLSEQLLVRRFRESTVVDENGYRVASVDGLFRS